MMQFAASLEQSAGMTYIVHKKLNYEGPQDEMKANDFDSEIINLLHLSPHNDGDEEGK